MVVTPWWNEKLQRKMEVFGVKPAALSLYHKSYIGYLNTGPGSSKSVAINKLPDM